MKRKVLLFSIAFASCMIGLYAEKKATAQKKQRERMLPKSQGLRWEAMVKL